jgi:hypothetical protein
MTKRPLGNTQECVLRALREHGSWSAGCGWTWNTLAGTEKILDSLVRRGLATKKLVRLPYQGMGNEYRPVVDGKEPT